MNLNITLKRATIGDDINLNSKVDVNTNAERMRIEYGAEDEDDQKRDGGVDDFHDG